MKERKEIKSLADLGKLKADYMFLKDEKRGTIEMTALLTVLRANLLDSGKISFHFEDLVEQSFDLTEPLLHDSYLHQSEKGSPIIKCIWDLIASQELIMEPNRTITISLDLRKELRDTLPREKRQK